MHINTFDRYNYQDSLVHQLDPRVKVVITLLFIVSNVLLPDGTWAAFVIAWGMILSITWLAKINVLLVLKRSLIVLPFMLAAITVIFTLPGEPLWTAPIGRWQVTISDAGIIRFLSILIRGWLSVQMAIILTTTTQFPDLMHALRHLKVPALLINIIGFMYRYLFVLADEATRLLRARAARSAQLPNYKSGGTIRWRAKVAGNMVGQLFVRSLDRSDRVYNAMLARGYQGRLLTLNPHHMTAHDWLWGGIGVTILLFIQLVGYYFS